jgi:hypothetical protein
MMRKKEADLMVKTKNVLGEEAEVYIGFPTDSTHAWEEKGITQNCQDCPSCIGEQEAKDIIKMVRKKRRRKKRRNKWPFPPTEYILGICTWGHWARILVPPRTSLQR